MTSFDHTPDSQLPMTADGVDLPFNGQISILERIRAWDGKKGLRFDPPNIAQPDRFPFGSSAWDGIVSHHMGPVHDDSAAERIAAVIEALIRLRESPTDSNRQFFYSIYQSASLIGDADDLCDKLSKCSDLTRADASLHARWLIHHAIDAEPVKLGILLAGLYGYDGCIDDLITLAKHSNFTLYATVAATRISANNVDILWKMARSANGWGKIHAVERLAKFVEERSDIQTWLLTDGCANEVMNEYLAYTCATAGKMRKGLSGSVSDPLLDGCILIMNALIIGGPAQDMDDYEDGEPCAVLLMDQLATRCNTLERLWFVGRLKRFIQWPLTINNDEPADDTRHSDVDRWLARAERGWTVDVRQDIAGRCETILQQPHWKQIVRETFWSGDHDDEYISWRVSAHTGFDIWPDIFEKLTANPVEGRYYSKLLEDTTLERGSIVVKFAEENLPLTKIATGPGEQDTFGPDHEFKSLLGWILQHLALKGGYSDIIVSTGLRSPVVRDRIQAFRILEQTTASTWGPNTRASLGLNVNDEPRDDLRAKAAELLRALNLPQSADS